MNKGKSEKERALRDFFAEKGLTFKDASVLLSTHPSAVGNLVSGRVPFGQKVAKKWEDVFGISADWLMYDKGNMIKGGEETAQTIVNVSHSSGNSVAVAGSHPDVLVGGQPQDVRDALEIIKKQQEQMDRIISLLERSMTK